MDRQIRLTNQFQPLLQYSNVKTKYLFIRSRYCEAYIVFCWREFYISFFVNYLFKDVSFKVRKKISKFDFSAIVAKLYINSMKLNSQNRGKIPSRKIKFEQILSIKIIS